MPTNDRTSEYRARSVTRRVGLLVASIVASLVCFGTGAQPAAAAINVQLNFQGKLTDPSGLSVPDGTYNLEFKIHNHATNTGGAQGVCSGSCLWMETRTAANRVQVTRGLFSVQLGSVTSLAGVNFDQDPLYLSVRVGGTAVAPAWDAEMTPRGRMAAAPQAIQSNNSTLLAGQAASYYNDAANLTGSIADARLSSNVALKNVNNGFSTSQTVTGTVTATNFSCTDCITAAVLAASSVGTSELADGTVALADIASGAGGVWNSVIGTGAGLPAATAANTGYLYLDTSVNGGTLYRSNGTSWVKTGRGATETAAASSLTCTGCVGSTELADGGVALIDLAANSVNSSKIVDGSIVSADIATGAVTSTEIADGTISYNDFAEQPNSRAHLNVAKNVPSGAWNNFAFDYANDNFGMWNGSGKITVPANMGGLYIITAEAQISAAATGRRLMHIKLNGVSNVCETGDHGSENAAVYLNCSDMTSLNPGDYITTELWQNSGSTLQVTDAHMRIYRLPG